MCSTDNKVRVSRTLFVAQYRGRLRGLVLQAGMQQIARQVAGFELVTAQCVLEQIFGQLGLADDFSANKIRLKFGQQDLVPFGQLPFGRDQLGKLEQIS